MHFYPARHPLTIGLAAAVPLLVCVSVIAVLGFALLRKWIGLAFAMFLATVNVVIQVPLFSADEAQASDASVVVLQTNIELGQGDVDRIAELVETHDVDILAVNELTAEAADAIAQTIVADLLPYSYLQPERRAAGTGVWSRYPITAPRRLDGFMLAALQMSIAMPVGSGTQTVSFFALHPPYPLEPAAWFEELGRIKTTLAAVPPGVPVIAPGDYNATYDVVAYRQLLTDGYRDAGEAAGAGWLPTYPADRFTGPLFAIDHVVVRDVSATRVATESVPGTDHLALVAELTLASR